MTTAEAGVPVYEGPPFGALVISLDFELHWGVRDWATVDGGYANNLVGARTVIPKMLECFQEFDVAATWATVGFLFAEDRRELERFRPEPLPQYRNPLLSPYEEPVGDSEADDPMHFAWSLIELITKTPRQEVASHTYSHFYCRERGQDERAFTADLDSAVAIARNRNVDVRSLVFPRNQLNTSYLDVVRKHGFVCVRGAQRGWLYRSQALEKRAPVSRAVRLLDSYVNITGHGVAGWHELAGAGDLCDIPASRFLRPFRRSLSHVDGLRVRRICKGLEYAARSRKVFHLWWHPHNFGVDQEENVSALRKILGHWQSMRDVYGMRSLSMAEAAEVAMRSRATNGLPPRLAGSD